MKIKIWGPLLGLAFIAIGAIAQTIPGGGGGSGCTLANPTATSATAAVNGTATTCMRSDAAPALGTTTGTGNLVRATSPALTTPNLGVPSAIDLSNATASTLAVAAINATGTQDSSHALFGDGTWKTVSGSGTVTGITAGTGINLSTNPCTTTCTASTTVSQNIQSSSPYATLSTDGGKVVAANSGSAFSITLSQANQTGFTGGFGVEYDNINAGALTVTATTSTFDNALTTLVLVKGQDATIWSDGTNYHSAVSLPVMAADTVLGNFSGTTNYPIAGAIGSCSSGSNALTYNTGTHAFGCNTISGSGTVNSGTAGQLAYYATSTTAVSGAASATISAGALSLGASGTVGTVALGNATSGTVTLGTVTGALGTVTASLPANTGTVAELNLAQVWTAQQSNCQTTLTISGSTFTPDGSCNDYKITLTGADTIANPSATPVTATYGSFYICQDSSGSRTVTWGSQFVAAGATSSLTLSTAASVCDTLPYRVIDSTHILVGAPILNATH